MRVAGIDVDDTGNLTEIGVDGASAGIEVNLLRE
jgi:hypothetical protein